VKGWIRRFPLALISGLAIVACCAWATARPQDSGIGVRQIVLGTEAEASIARDRILAGVPFEIFARERSLDSFTAARGGFLGRVSISDLRPEFGNALTGLSPGEVSPPVRIGSEYFLFAVLTEADTNWVILEEAGLRAAQQGLDDEAFGNFETALELAEEFGPQDYRLARSLANLGELHRVRGNASEAASLFRRSLPILEELAAEQEGFRVDLAQSLNSLGLVLYSQEQYAAAEPLYQRAMAIREEIRGPEHPEVAIALNNLAELYFAENRYAEAGPLYERAVAILTDALGPAHSVTVSTKNNLVAFREALLPEVLERFASIVFFATFKDEQFEAETQTFEETLALTPLAEESYIEMKDAFFQADLFGPAEHVLQRGMKRFPDSRLLLFHMGQLIETLGRTRDALNVFDAATRLSPPDLDPTMDTQQLALLYRRMGDMHTILSEFDEAMADYTQALEIDPNTPSGHVSFGQMYFLSNRLDEALEEYSRAAEVEPDDFALQVNLAEVYIALGQWSEAAAAAEMAQQLNPSNSRGLYLRGTALVRMGEADEGRQDLQEFARLERETQDTDHQLREAEAINSDAVAAIVAGDSETGIDLFRRGIESYPENRPLRVNLGLAHLGLGQYREAAEVFENVVDLEISDHYLVHKNLAQVYEALGEVEAARQHQTTYREKRDRELGEVLVFGQ
jgi:tetratricopeptide (TPR) repeat protein